MAYVPNPEDASRPVGSDPPATLPTELRGIKQRINDINSALDGRLDSLETFRTQTIADLEAAEEAIQELIDLVEGQFTDNSSTSPSVGNQWSYTDPSGKIWKGGYSTILDNGTAITFNTAFPTKCLYVGFTPWATGGSGSTSQIHIEGTPVFQKTGFSAVSDGGNRAAVWMAFGY
jgi:hypothetical protein